MSATVQTQTKNSGAGRHEPLTPVQGGMLQRKCACGSSPGMSGECQECQGKRLTIQRYSLDRASLASLLPSSSQRPSTAIPPTAPGYSFDHVRVHNHAPHTVQAKLAVSSPSDLYEQEADRVARQVMASIGSAADGLRLPSPSVTGPVVQRQALDEQAAGPEVMPPTEEPPTETSEAEAEPAGLIVEDDAPDLGPGQMRKSEFLDELQLAVCDAADAELAAVGRNTEGCPYIEHWIEYYRTQDSGHLSRAIRRYAPETDGVTSAWDYIPLISERVRLAVATWATTGEITGVPTGVSAALPGSSPSANSGGAASASAGIQFKKRGAGKGEAVNTAAIPAQLSSGRPLESGVRSRMESAFGYDFSRVQVHTDAKASKLSTNLNARAFTIGSDVAFGAGEYQPGTMIGDALIAHELAHVVQQSGAKSTPMTKGESEPSTAASATLEEDADASAVGAVLSLWGRAKMGLSNVAKNAMPRMRSGLRLSRCCTGLQWKPFCILGDKTFQSTVKGELDTLNTTSQGSGAFGALDKNGDSIDIKPLSATGFLPGKISYDVSGSGPADRCPGSDGAWTAAPRRVYLFHEVSHAYIYHVLGKGTHAERECMATGLGSYFTSTAYNENRLRCEMSLPIRPCYDGVCTKFEPPTCGTKAEPK